MLIERFEGIGFPGNEITVIPSVKCLPLAVCNATFLMLYPTDLTLQKIEKFPHVLCIGNVGEKETFLIVS